MPRDCLQSSGIHRYAWHPRGREERKKAEANEPHRIHCRVRDDPYYGALSANASREKVCTAQGLELWNINTILTANLSGSQGT